MVRSPKKGQQRRAATGAGTALPPPGAIAISTMEWPLETVIHRVHLSRLAGEEFNPGLRGSARFSPIKDAFGALIPTLYGGSTFECALMETVFHDVPYAAGLKTFDKTRLDQQVHSQLTCGASLVLADFRSKALRKLGVPRNRIIDTENDQYPVTRKWAEAIHHQHPGVQGICWTSRQDDSALALIVFGDRLGKGVLKQIGASRSLISDFPTYCAILALAERIGVEIVPESF